MKPAPAGYGPGGRAAPQIVRVTTIASDELLAHTIRVSVYD